MKLVIGDAVVRSPSASVALEADVAQHAIVQRAQFHVDAPLGKAVE